MAIWIQALSWTLIYSLGQGMLVYASLCLVLKLTPNASANVKYHLSLSALTILLAWFVATWWQQFHSLTLVNEQLSGSEVQHASYIYQPQWTARAIESQDGYHWLLSSVKVIFPWLSAFYIIGLMLMLVRLSAGMHQLFSLKKNEIAQADTLLVEVLGSLKKRIHFERPVQLFISAKAGVPLVIGFLKPMILMPAATIAQLSTEQIETILLHELAHIKRYDYLVNILQTVVETILFFNPFVWMVSAITRREREHCCDDLVLDHTREPLSYATALAALATHTGTVSTLTVAASGNSNHLFNRIKRIMEMKKNQFSYSRMVAAILMVTAITCSTIWLTPSFARTKKDKPDKSIASTSAPVQKEAQQGSSGEKKKQLPTKKDELANAVAPPAPGENAGTAKVNESEESKLINQMINDRLVDQFKGFVVEKKQHKLYINGQELSADIANRYLPMTTKEVIRVQISSFEERLRQHPNADFIQLLLPATLASPCVDYKPKEGC
jgi:beta-lactamase regulating signal transducer with metallopeptidase domain